jgi:hypothetical protein
MFMKTKLLIIGLAFITITTLVSAQNHGPGQRHQTLKCKGIALVDDNKNGLCDNYENRSPNANAGTGNINLHGYRGGTKQNNGKCGIGQGKGFNPNIVDSDKNGICDFRETPEKK